MIEVLAIAYWDSGGALYRCQLRHGQLTKCRANGIVFYVRENIDGRDSFLMSSNERWGTKGGNKATSGPSRRWQILDLCCPKQHFERIAELVHKADPMKRAVRSHRTFTPAWAEKQIRDYARLV